MNQIVLILYYKNTGFTTQNVLTSPKTAFLMLIIIAREEMYLLCKNTIKFYDKDKELVHGGQNMLSKVKRRFCFTEVLVILNR